MKKSVYHAHAQIFRKGEVIRQFDCIYTAYPPNEGTGEEWIISLRQEIRTEFNISETDEVMMTSITKLN